MRLESVEIIRCCEWPFLGFWEARKFTVAGIYKLSTPLYPNDTLVADSLSSRREELPITNGMYL